MNSPSGTVSESGRDSQINNEKAASPAFISAPRPFYWSIRRELWENRSIYIAPLAVAALFLFGFLISMIHPPEQMRAALAIDPSQRHELIEQPYTFAALLLMGVAFIVSIFYCLDALHGERRERSILFWKSLPVSDLTTVLSKASIPLVVLPLLTFAITVATHWIMLLLSSAALLAKGQSVAALWRELPLFQMWTMLLYHLVTVHALWYAPIFGWMILVSVWARRAPFLWAVLPLVAISVVEKIAFNTQHFAQILGSRFVGGSEGAGFPVPGTVSIHESTHFALGQFLSMPDLWIGLAVAAACLAAAVRLRRYQGPI